MWCLEAGQFWLRKFGINVRSGAPLSQTYCFVFVLEVVQFWLRNLGLKFFIDFFINIHCNKLLGTTDDITDDNITKDNDILLSST